MKKKIILPQLHTLLDFIVARFAMRMMIIKRIDSFTFLFEEFSLSFSSVCHASSFPLPIVSPKGMRCAHDAAMYSTVALFWDDIFRLFYGITQLLIVIVQFVLFSSLSISFLIPFTLAHLTDFNLRCGRPKNMKMFYDSQNTWKRDRCSTKS